MLGVEGCVGFAGCSALGLFWALGLRVVQGLFFNRQHAQTKSSLPLVCDGCLARCVCVLVAVCVFRLSDRHRSSTQGRNAWV